MHLVRRLQVFQRSERESVRDAEHGEIRTTDQCQRRNRGDRVARRPPQASCGEPELGDEVRHGGISIDLKRSRPRLGRTGLDGG